MQSENYLANIYIYRNMLNALLGEDPDFTILEIDQPLPDGTIEKHEDGKTLNIVCSDVNKLVILRDKISERIEIGQTLYIDYYYASANANGYQCVNNGKINAGGGTHLDIALLFEGNPHYSRLFSGWTPMGPIWCIVFKPKLVQYFTDDGTSLTGRRSCAMEDIARVIFPEMSHYRIYFSTENLESESEGAANEEIEEHNFHNCDRIEAYTEPQPALLFWHNLAIYHCHEDDNWYATCDMRFMGFKIENTIVRCKSEAKAREVLHELEYNPRYVEFRNHPETKDCYFIDKGSEHRRKWGFFGDWGSKEFNCNSWRDGFFGDNAERR